MRVVAFGFQGFLRHGIQQKAGEFRRLGPNLEAGYIIGLRLTELDRLC
jgi:hypothetical protein